MTDHFFNVPKHPKSTFKSTAIKAGSDKEGMTHTVSGNFQIAGTTKLITFPAKIAIAADKVEANTEFVINRQDFGISYPGRKDDLIKDNVAMTVSFTAPRS